MQSSPQIAAVFATMNRADTAVACVDALRRQSRPPRWVIVADNVSSDGTAERLRGMEGLPFQLIVHSMEANLGNAGGIEAAMAVAFEKGADAVWILDDDSWPQAEALEGLLEGWDGKAVRHSLQVDPKTGDFTWPLPVSDGAGGWRLVRNSVELEHAGSGVSKAAWTGALISRPVYDAVGPVNGALFIRGEDEDYPRRIEAQGFSFEWVGSSVLDHPGPTGVREWRFLGKRLFLEPGLADWKLYYKVRNMVWMKTREGAVAAACMAMAYTIGILFTEGPQRLGVLSRAISDGWRGRLGPRMLP